MPSGAMFRRLEVGRGTVPHDRRTPPHDALKRPPEAVRKEAQRQIHRRPDRRVPASLRGGDVSLARGEIVLRAEQTKDREKRIIPISSRLRRVLEMRRNAPDGRPLPPTAHVFGDEIGHRVGSVRRAWQTAVLRAHGHKPVWIWKKKQRPNDKGSTKLSPESQAA
jgi:hypothetical protein